MKQLGHHTRMDTGEKDAPAERLYSQNELLQWGFETTREPGPILMCWRAFRPEKLEDRDAESMSSAT